MERTPQKHAQMDIEADRRDMNFTKLLRCPKLFLTSRKSRYSLLLPKLYLTSKKMETEDQDETHLHDMRYTKLQWQEELQQSDIFVKMFNERSYAIDSVLKPHVAIEIQKQKFGIREGLFALAHNFRSLSLKRHVELYSSEQSIESVVIRREAVYNRYQQEISMGLTFEIDIKDCLIERIAVDNVYCIRIVM